MRRVPGSQPPSGARTMADKNRWCRADAWSGQRRQRGLFGEVRARAGPQADRGGVVSHAGTVLQAELANRVGLTAALSEATDALRERRSGHDPGRVLVGLAVATADGARTMSDVQRSADQVGLHGLTRSVASTATIWLVLVGIDDLMLADIRQVWAAARDRAWSARGELTGAELQRGDRTEHVVHGE